MRDDEQRPISVPEAKRLFADWANVPAIVLAVSGGPDSLALMVLAARWRRSLKRGPELIAVTIDHGLREASAREARDVKKRATELGLPHRTLNWRGDKPAAGVPAAARAARYALLAKAARRSGATHIFTAHTRDDQAETVLMRLARGSGISGLAAMARQSERDGLRLARPLLDIAKSRLIATLARAKIDFAVDPTNSDPRFMRPRLRALMAAFADEGCDSRNLARLAARLRRANEALEILVDSAERSLTPERGGEGWDAVGFAALPAEIRVRLLLRSIDRFGHEGPAELGKVETLLGDLDRAMAKTGANKAENRLKRTLAGALVTLAGGRLRIAPAPPRQPRSR
jgi:tRNA(Ile)-lysidine synthase